MTYNSLEFIVFAFIFYAIWPFFAPHKQARLILITVSSSIFYGWWGWQYLALLILSAAIDFYAALGMEKFPHRKKALVTLSIVTNIGTLVAFKYLGFFTRIAQAVTQSFGVGSLPIIDLVLPIGISFYTFQSMSYTIDVYRGIFSPTKSMWHYFAYLFLFTQLVAGPIDRSRDLMPQLEGWTKPPSDKVWDGLKLIATGFFKKCFVADNVAVAVAYAFTSPNVSPSAPFWWAAALLFQIQIYADFSGYSDIARGLSKLMGYELQLNFDHPSSMAVGVTDYWRRWHITLGSWFRDYVYLPLGGGPGRNSWLTYRNTMIVFVLIGLWHGPAWNFVIFGSLNGAMVCVERFYYWPKRLAALPGRWFWPRLAMVIIMGSVGQWFVARSVEQGLAIMKTMLNPAAFSDWSSVLELGMIPLTVGLIAAACEYTAAYLVTDRVKATRWYQTLEPSIYAVFIAAAIFLRGPDQEFIYFQF